ncbi:hypothetical protein Tco_0059532 [Tanacetum coccineum]
MCLTVKESIVIRRIEDVWKTFNCKFLVSWSPLGVTVLISASFLVHFGLGRKMEGNVWYSPIICVKGSYILLDDALSSQSLFIVDVNFKAAVVGYTTSLTPVVFGFAVYVRNRISIQSLRNRIFRRHYECYGNRFATPSRGLLHSWQRFDRYILGREFKELIQKYTRFNAQSFQDAMICNMDSIGIYILKIFLHQQRTTQLLKQKKLMQTHEDYSNLIQALNVDSLKVDLVVIQNTCSEKEDSNSENASSKSVKESNLDYATKDVHVIKYKMSKAKERCIDTLLQLMGNVKKLVAERTRHQRQYDRRLNKRQMQTQESKIDTRKVADADLVVTESSGTESKVPIYDEEPMAVVQLIAECNIFATEQQHTKQPEIINEGKVDQYTEKFQVKSLLLNSSPDNKTTEFSNQSLESENIFLKKTVAQFQKDFARMKAHCISLELKYHNQALKSGQHGHILNETSNKAKIKKEIDAYETINIELEHSVAKLLTENEHLNKENKIVKKHYKDFSDSRKGVCNCGFKNELRKLKENSVDTKFAKTSVLGKPVLQSLRNQSVVKQPNAFKSERPQISKPRFASQVDVKNDLSKLVTQHYLPKRRESVFAKLDQVIASRESRNSSKNMPRYSSNDMVHNYYLEEARKKTQERNRNSKSSMMHTASPQNTTKGSKPKPRSNNQTSRSLPVSKSSCITITAMPKADHSKNSTSFSDSKHFKVNSRAKIHSYKTRNNNKPVDQKSHTQKPGRQIFTRHRFSPNKTSDVHKKTSPRSDLRWKPTGRIFKSVGLRWIPTRKLFASCTSKDDSEPTHGSNVDIPNIHECKQTLDLSAGTSLTGQQKQRIYFSAVQASLHNVNRSSYIRYDSYDVNDRVGNFIRSLFDEYFNGENLVVSKSSVITTSDASDKRQQQPDSTSST